MGFEMDEWEGVIAPSPGLKAGAVYSSRARVGNRLHGWVLTSVAGKRALGPTLTVRSGDNMIRIAYLGNGVWAT